MSTSEWFAKVEPKDGAAAGGTRYIATGNIAGGNLALDRRDVLEPLSSPGADGRRYRRIFRQKSPVIINAAEPCTDYFALETAITQLIGKLCRLTIRVGGKTNTYQNATVIDAPIVRRTQQLYGYGSTGEPRTLLYRIIIDCPNTTS